MSVYVSLVVDLYSFLVWGKRRSPATHNEEEEDNQQVKQH